MTLLRWPCSFEVLGRPAKVYELLPPYRAYKSGALKARLGAGAQLPVLSRWAKLLMMQATISLAILVLLAARAVNILGLEAATDNKLFWIYP
jgi:hypothetical protein